MTSYIFFDDFGQHGQQLLLPGQEPFLEGVVLGAGDSEGLPGPGGAVAAEVEDGSVFLDAGEGQHGEVQILLFREPVQGGIDVSFHQVQVLGGGQDHLGDGDLAAGYIEDLHVRLDKLSGIGVQLRRGGGEKLERWDKQILVRPDPQAIWETDRRDRRWKTANARYSRSSTGGGHWDKSKLPESWPIHYKELTFQVKPMNFKHTGLFPEQAANWDFAMEQIRAAGRPIRVLNLFAYTGGATVACAKAGASVCHVDAAKGMVAWAKDNARLSGLADAPIRWIVDDCAKFVEREIRRGKTYDAIIMDPPSYGRGPSGEVWKLEENLYPFVRLCAQVLSDNPLFVILNSYTTGLAPSVLGYILQMLVGRRFGGHVTWDELGLPCTDSGMALPCGATGRWCAD